MSTWLLLGCLVFTWCIISAAEISQKNYWNIRDRIPPQERGGGFEVVACADGHALAAAREALFDKCRAYVGVVARAQVESWMRTKIDASDLVQQTLLDAHRGLGLVSRPSPFWMCSLMVSPSSCTTTWFVIGAAAPATPPFVEASARFAP